MTLKNKIVAMRLIQSGLICDFGSIDDCIKFHFGIQAQMKNVPFISIALRTSNTTIDVLKEMIMNDRSIVRLWGLRYTLHYYSVDDWNLLCSFLMEKPDWFERRMRKSSIDFDELLLSAINILDGRTFITRELLIEEGISSEFLGPWGDLFISLNNQGLICNISDGYGEAKYANRKLWTPNNLLKKLKYEDALKQIIRRYFTCYGPATVYDLLHWLGFSTSKTAYTELETICYQMNSLVQYAPGLWVTKTNLTTLINLDAESILEDNIFFLGKFDPLLLAYSDKSWLVEEKYNNIIWRKAGHVSGTVIVNGSACATWNTELKKDCIKVSIIKFKCCVIDKNRISKSILKIACLYQCNTAICYIFDTDNTLTDSYAWEVNNAYFI